MIKRLANKLLCVLLLMVLLFSAGCEGGDSALVEELAPLGEDFLTRLYAGDFDGTYAQFSDDLRISITRRAWEQDIFPQMYEFGGDITGVRFVSAYPASGGSKLWLHMEQKNTVVIYCFVFNPERVITEFTYR